MQKLRNFLPHLSLSLNLAVLIVLYLDGRNPMMGFLIGRPFQILCSCACAAAILQGILSSAEHRKNTRNRFLKTENKTKTRE